LPIGVSWRGRKKKKALKGTDQEVVVADGFRTIEPKILYFGTPVALISSLSEDGSTNLAPISSFWALGWSAMLGLLGETKTADNLARVPECVVNIPSPEMWQQVEKQAPLTGKDPVPDLKAHQFRFEPDKFGVSGLSPMPSEVVSQSARKSALCIWKPGLFICTP
jgi:flavin reductase (DIM6/NTAB) family NADH-FMN oxidoreductase RutF